MRILGLTYWMRESRSFVASIPSVALLLCLGLTGCETASTVSEGDHLEHHIPEHKPATFADAVEQVRSRNDRLAAEFESADMPAVDRQLTELLDIVGWLPEIAADSPMKKPQWDQANAVSRELLLFYQGIAATTKRQTRGTWPTDVRRVEELLSVLTKLAPFANAPL